MSVPEPLASPGRVLAWDSDFFGFRIGRLHGHQLTADSARAALAWAESERLRCLYFSAAPEDPVTLEQAHAGGFKFVDLRVELSLPLAGPTGGGPAAIRPAVAGDLGAVEALSRVAHHDTRFFKDPGFPRDRASDLYAAWIRRDFREHHLLVAEAAGTVAGYISCQTEGTPAIGRIGLVAVDASARRHGMGRALVAAALGWFHRQGCGEARVVTQASNVAAQRVYQALGFRTAETSATFHRWFSAT